ncbi:SDR family oxidoreductase [Pseudarthrobacter sp. P1]|uniref:SDR family oxidoreductase n=1 Tax=Pseudarthrobacter sp. P1 TaxID=3418418 RepID=UPI003CF8232F
MALDGGARRAIVTGAGSGIGRAVARALLDDGYQVALAGRRPDALAATAGEHPNAVCIPTDVAVEAAVENLFNEVSQRFGRLDVLFNNAGVFGPMASLDEVSLAEWEGTLAVNLTGAMLCARAAFRQMRAQTPQGGLIINNGSISAHSPRPLSVAYTVSKHAISGLTKSLDLDGRAYGIRCGQIDIGNTATEIMSELGVRTGALQADGRRMVEPTFPVAEAAKVVLMMASLPPSATIGSIQILASGMPFVGRG